jgi:dynein heavy chain 1
VSTEFLALMKKVAKSPLVMDVLNIPNSQRQLERLADLLGKIQKALGEYLERERASFPRYIHFYIYVYIKTSISYYKVIQIV